MDMYNMNQISKNALEKSKRIEKQVNNYLTETYAKQRADANAKETAINEAALSAARFGYASTLERSKNRVKALSEEVSYINNASTIAMTEMISQLIESSLLLDETAYAELNPKYKTEIRETVRGLLENGNIKQTGNPNTIAIMEYVSKTLPSTDTGKYLTEDELSALFKKAKPIEVENAIRNLSGDVSKHVATLVEKEQKKVSDVQKDLDVVSPQEEAPEEMPNEEVPPEEIPAEEAPQNEDLNALPPDDGNDVQGAGKQIHIEPDGTTAIAMQNGQVAINQDGSMDIQLAENILVRETPRCGLLESLAVNAAMSDIEKGKGYNSDRALANAIMYITITEAMNVAGLIDIDENTYANIIVNAGGSLNESKKGDKLRAKAFKLKQKAAELEVQARKVDAKKDGIPLAKEETLQEATAYKWRPDMNRNSGNDLAERIRQKRLAQQGTILTENKKN